MEQLASEADELGWLKERIFVGPRYWRGLQLALSVLRLVAPAQIRIEISSCFSDSHKRLALAPNIYPLPKGLIHVWCALNREKLYEDI